MRVRHHPRIRKQIRLIINACHHIVQGLIRKDYALIKTWAEKLHGYSGELKEVTTSEDFQSNHESD